MWHDSAALIFPVRGTRASPSSCRGTLQRSRVGSRVRRSLTPPRSALMLSSLHPWRALRLDSFEIERRSPRSPQDRAYTLLAEMLLLQHSCHWFCRSRPVASARLLARHKTRHDQVLQSVGAATREGYGQIVGA